MVCATDVFPLELPVDPLFDVLPEPPELLPPSVVPPELSSEAVSVLSASLAIDSCAAVSADAELDKNEGGHKADPVKDS